MLAILTLASMSLLSSAEMDDIYIFPIQEEESHSEPMHLVMIDQYEEALLDKVLYQAQLECTNESASFGFIEEENEDEEKYRHEEVNELEEINENEEVNELEKENELVEKTENEEVNEHEKENEHEEEIEHEEVNEHEKENEHEEENQREIEGKELTTHGCYFEAISVYNELIEESPENADYYYSLGKLYSKIECYTYAIHTFIAGLDVKPDNTDILTALAYTYLKRGTSVGKFWDHFQWFWNYPYMFYFVPEDIYPRYNWDDIDTSRCYFSRVLYENPCDSEALAGMGKIYALEDEKEQAEELLCESLAIDPENERTQNYYAALLATEGRYFSSRCYYEKVLEIEPCNKDLFNDYNDVLWKSSPQVSILGFYSQENEKDFINANEKDWTARRFNYGGGFEYSMALKDRLKVFCFAMDEVIALKNLLNQTKIYSLNIIQGGLGFSFKATPYLTVISGCNFSRYEQKGRSTFHTNSGWYVQPFLGFDYERKRNKFILETNADSAVVARNFDNNHSTLVDRQFLRALYEYNFGNRTLIGSTVSNAWYINRIKDNQQQIGSAWFQYGIPYFWQNVVIRYQFIYGRFNRITQDYYTYRFQTTHWLDVSLSKSWCDNTLITEAGYGHAWQRGFEQGQINPITPVTPFHIVHREINACYARLQLMPGDDLRIILTGTYTLDTLSYTTGSITGKLEYKF
jgi:Flp pilus assembly protein TadD